MSLVRVPTAEIRAYLARHRDALMVARRELNRIVAKGERPTLGDLAFHVARWTGYETSEWQARAILSHAVRNGAFGAWRAVPGKGLTTMAPKTKTRRKAA